MDIKFKEMEFNILWTKEDKIALALSGGVDSIVLFHLLTTKYKNSYKELVVFHINHGLREESTEEAIFVENLVKNTGVKFLKAELKMKERKRASHISEEMYARQLRYETFEKMAKEQNIKIVLTGHHKNDNIENIVMRLFSGRNIDHTLLIEQEITIGNLAIKRPLLNILKKDLEQYAKKNNLKYYEDITNFDTDYTRNFVRHEIVPLLPNINVNSFDNIINFANYYKNINATLKNNTLEKLENVVQERNTEKVVLDAKQLLILSDEEIYFLLKKVIDELNVEKIKQKSLFTIIQQLKRNSTNVSYDLKNNLKIVYEYGKIYIHKIEKKCYNNEIELKIEKITSKEYTFYDTKFIITENKEEADFGFNLEDLPLTINTRKNGDVIKRGKITKKLSRIFIDEKVPKEQRDRLAIVRNKNQEILAIIGLTTSNKNKKYDYYIKMKGHQPWKT